ncbi:hypothetical protein D3C72_1976530 [compost metagenome]
MTLPQRQAVAIPQITPFQPTKSGFVIGATRAEHFRYRDAPAYRQIGAHAAFWRFQYQLLAGIHRIAPAGPQRFAIELRIAAGTGQSDPT